MNCAILLLTHKPCREQHDFFQTMREYGYDVFTVVDDNSVRYPGENYVQYDNSDCAKLGWKNVNFTIKKGSPSAWDKGLRFAFEKEYEHVWFIEDDVFIPNKDAIQYIDKKYTENTADILSTTHGVNATGTLDWHWKYAQGHIALPWASSMVCAVRLSRRVLTAVDNYRLDHGTLLFLEFFFNTLALHNEYTVLTAPELAGIVYRRDWKKSDIQQNHLYHPVKSWEEQKRMRLSS